MQKQRTAALQSKHQLATTFIDIPALSRASKEQPSGSFTSRADVRDPRDSKIVLNTINQRPQLSQQSSSLSLSRSNAQFLNEIDYHYEKLQQYQGFLKEVKNFTALGSPCSCSNPKSLQNKYNNRTQPDARFFEEANSDHHRSSVYDSKYSSDIQLQSTSVFVQSNEYLPLPLQKGFQLTLGSLSQMSPLNYSSKNICFPSQNQRMPRISLLNQSSRKSNNADLRSVYSHKEERLSVVRPSQEFKGLQENAKGSDDPFNLPQQFGKSRQQDLGQKTNLSTNSNQHEELPVPVNHLSFEHLLEKEMSKYGQSPVQADSLKESQSAIQDRLAPSQDKMKVEEVSTRLASQSISPEVIQTQRSPNTLCEKTDRNKQQFLKRGEGALSRRPYQIGGLLPSKGEERNLPKAKSVRTKKLSPTPSLNHRDRRSMKRSRYTPRQKENQSATTLQQKQHNVSENVNPNKQEARLTQSLLIRSPLTPIKEDIASPKAQAIKIAVKAFKNDSASVKVVEDRPESAQKHSEIKKLKQEMDKLAKKKLFYETQLRQRRDNHQKTVTSLKHQLTKKNAEIKQSQQSLKERISSLEMENQKLKKSTFMKKQPETMAIKAPKQSQKSINSSGYDYQKERNRVFERIGHSLRGGSQSVKNYLQVPIQVPKRQASRPNSKSNERPDSVASFERMERKVRKEAVLKGMSMNMSPHKTAITDKAGIAESAITISLDDGPQNNELRNGMKIGGESYKEYALSLSSNDRDEAGFNAGFQEAVFLEQKKEVDIQVQEEDSQNDSQDYIDQSRNLSVVMKNIQEEQSP